MSPGVSPILIALALVHVPAAAAAADSLQPAAGPKATVAETAHDFGTVKEGATLKHAFVLRNEGAAPLTIDGVDLQSPGMRVSFAPVVEPGSAAKIELEWDGSHLDGRSEARALVRLGDPARPRIELVLTATVVRAIDILPMPAVFFSVYKGESATKSVTIANREASPLEILSLEPAGTHFVAKLVSIEPGRTYRLDVSVPADAPLGRYMESVHLNTNHPTKRRLTIAVNVFVKNELYANPEVVDFGQISLSQVATTPALLKLLTQSLMIRRRTGDFAVTAVTTDIPALAVRVSPAQGRSPSFQLDVSLAGERLVAGAIDGTIRVTTDDKAFPELTIPVRGRLR